MVKKTSILNKLKNRWKSSPVRVETRADARAASGAVGSGAERTPANGAANRVAQAQQATANRLQPDRAEPAAPLGNLAAERMPGRKMSAKEDALVALGEGFRELSGLVRGVQTRLDAQGDRSQSFVEDLRALPALGQAQIELLRQMAGQLEQQTATNGKLLSTLGELPNALSGVQAALNRAAATDERTAKTLSEFQGTMDRIHGAMEKVVDSAGRQVDAAQALVDRRDGERDDLLEAVRDGSRRDNAELAEQLSAARREDMEAMRSMHTRQVAQLDELGKSSGRFGNAVVVLLALTFLAIAGVLTAIVVG